MVNGKYCTCDRLRYLTHNCNLSDSEMISWLQDREYSISLKQSNIKRAAKKLSDNWAFAQSAHLQKMLKEISTVREYLISKN